MSVKVRQYNKRGKSGWEVDIVLRMPNDEVIRERVKAPVTSKSGAKYWGKQLEIELLRHGKQTRDKETQVPTLVEFTLRFMESYVKANRQKPSTIANKQAILDGTLLPLLGMRRLDNIREEDVQQIKAELKEKKPKTVNNVLTVLSKLLKVAVKWKVIPAMPAQIELLKFEQPEVEFYEFEQYQKLVEAAEKLDRHVLLTVLLAGDAGLRTGEIIALDWTDIDFKRGLITVSKSEWKDQVTLPKGGRARRLPMTKKLAAVASSSPPLARPEGPLPRQRHLHVEADFEHLDDIRSAAGRAQGDRE